MQRKYLRRLVENKGLSLFAMGNLVSFLTTGFLSWRTTIDLPFVDARSLLLINAVIYSPLVLLGSVEQTLSRSKVNDFIRADKVVYRKLASLIFLAILIHVVCNIALLKDSTLQMHLLAFSIFCSLIFVSVGRGVLLSKHKFSTVAKVTSLETIIRLLICTFGFTQHSLLIVVLGQFASYFTQAMIFIVAAGVRGIKLSQTNVQDSEISFSVFLVGISLINAMLTMGLPILLQVSGILHGGDIRFLLALSLLPFFRAPLTLIGMFQGALIPLNKLKPKTDAFSFVSLPKLLFLAFGFSLLVASILPVFSHSFRLVGASAIFCFLAGYFLIAEWNLITASLVAHNREKPAFYTWILGIVIIVISLIFFPNNFKALNHFAWLFLFSSLCSTFVSRVLKRTLK